MKRYQRGLISFAPLHRSSSILEYVERDGADCLADKFSPSGWICARKAGAAGNGDLEIEHGNAADRPMPDG